MDVTNILPMAVGIMIEAFLIAAGLVALGLLLRMATG